jgi:hypothetical protein
MKYLSWISALVLALAFPPVVYGQSTDSPVERTDPCATLQKSNMIFGISTGGYSTVIHGVPSKRIFVLSADCARTTMLLSAPVAEAVPNFLFLSMIASVSEWEDLVPSLLVAGSHM